MYINYISLLKTYYWMLPITSQKYSFIFLGLRIERQKTDIIFVNLCGLVQTGKVKSNKRKSSIYIYLFSTQLVYFRLTDLPKVQLFSE